MAWDFIISGELHFSEKTQIENWLNAIIKPEQYENEIFVFTQPLKWVEDKANFTVEEFFVRWAAFATQETYSLDFEVEQKNMQFDWRGYLDKDTVADLGNEITGAFCCAGVCGGSGELYFIGIGNTIAFKITTSPEKTEIIELSAEVADELAESERIMAVMDWSEKQIKARMKKKKS